MLLKISGSGHKLEVTVNDECTVGDIKRAIHELETSLPPPYQRLLWRGKVLDDDSAVACETYNVQDRTKLMLMHSAAYVKDKDGLSSLQSIVKEIDDIETKASTLSLKEIDHCLTLICCKLDALDIGSSDVLRQLRRNNLKRCDDITQKYKS